MLHWSHNGENIADDRSASTWSRKYVIGPQLLCLHPRSSYRDYAKAVKTTVASINDDTKEKARMQLLARLREHRENCRKEIAKHTVILTMKEVSEATRKSITLMHSKEITEHCQQAINKTLSTSGVKPEIRGNQ